MNDYGSPIIGLGSTIGGPQWPRRREFPWGEIIGAAIGILLVALVVACYRGIRAIVGKIRARRGSA
jgi:hypothetical protein